MDFKSKIDIILHALMIKLWRLAEESELGTTLEKAYSENREMRPANTQKFLQKIGISPEWWEKTEGGMEGMFTKDFKITRFGDFDREKPKNPEEIYKDLVEANTEYRIIPKTVLDGEYRMILKSEIESKEKMLWQVIDAKNYTIAQLEKEISELRSGTRITAMHSKDAQ
jgi:hypothetical protein